MSTHKIAFYEDLTKIIFQLSSNTHLISSSEILHKTPPNNIKKELNKNHSLGTVSSKLPGA